MRGLLTHFAIVGLLIFSKHISAQVQLVSVTACGPAAEPGIGCAIPATGAGNLIVIGWQLGAHANVRNTIVNITDDAGNIYTQAPGARSVDSNGVEVADIWYAQNSVAGASLITINPSYPVPHGAAVIWEFSGADPFAPLDQTAFLSDQPATSTPLGAPVTTTSASEVIISLAADSGNITGIAPGSSFLNDSVIKTNGWAHLFTSNAGTYSGQWTGTTGTYCSSTASFKAAGGGPPPPTVSLSWNPSTSPNITGYNLYRGSVSGGPYSKINTALIPSTSYSDNAVQSGLTYYYVSTAVDYTGAESTYSNEAIAMVPQTQ